MGRKAKYTKELKIENVKRYLKDELENSLAKEYGMTPNQFGNHANPNLLPLFIFKFFLST